ncbi:hypothetical protein GN316_21095 [Xylophilus sp. Kf1]|nr:hypothetical protein [Xylophilus sp. Kf1]
METATPSKRPQGASTIVRDITIIVLFVLFIGTVIFQSKIGTGDKERERALRVIAQCWKNVAEKKMTSTGGPAQAQTCEQMERGFRLANGSTM